MATGKKTHPPAGRGATAVWAPQIPPQEALITARASDPQSHSVGEREGGALNLATTGVEVEAHQVLAQQLRK